MYLQKYAKRRSTFVAKSSIFLHYTDNIKLFNYAT